MPPARWFAVALVAAAGCLESPPGSQPPDDPTDAASAGDSGREGLDGALTCPELETPGGQCGLDCTNDCLDEICVVDCTAGPGCHDVIACAPDFDCSVDCGVIGICTEATLNCPLGHACEVFCSADDSCMNMVVNCSDGPCAITCSGDPEACSQLTVNCGTGACTTRCLEAQSSAPVVHCETSCDCTRC